MDVGSTDLPSKYGYNAYFHSSCLSKLDVDKLVNQYKYPSSYVCHVAHPADRGCNKNKDFCIYKDCLKVGLRFPLHPFIPALFNSFEVHPSHLTHNAWRLINVFLVRCIQLGVNLM